MIQWFNRLLPTSLKKLKLKYEKVIYSIDFEELSYEKIGKIMVETLGRTKGLIHRARKALKVKLEKGVGKGEKYIEETKKIYESQFKEIEKDLFEDKPGNKYDLNNIKENIDRR